MDHSKQLKKLLKIKIDNLGYNLNRFSQISGINRGVLSATLNENSTKMISFDQLLKMNIVLKIPEKQLFDLFLKACTPNQTKPDWRKINPLLKYCIQHDYHTLVDNILNIVFVDNTRIKILFLLVEQLYKNNEPGDLLRIYTHIVDNELDFHSEHLAVSHYRIYMLSLSSDLKSNIKIALKLDNFCRILPIDMQPEAYLQLFTIAYITHDWDKAHAIAQNLYEVTLTLYEYHCDRQNFEYSNELKRPLVGYYAQSQLMHFTAFEYEGKYSEAEQYLHKLKDLSWFEGLDEHGWNEIQKFKMYYAFNYHNLKLLSGHSEYLDDYFGLIDIYPGEVLPTLLVALQASNKHRWNIDMMLERFKDALFPDNIEQFINTLVGSYNLQSSLNRYINIYYELILYYVQEARLHPNLEKSIVMLQDMVEKYNKSRTVDCLKLLKHLRSIPKMET